MNVLPTAITVGDYHGIGSEVIAKGLKRLRAPTKDFVLFGDPACFLKWRKHLPALNWVEIDATASPTKIRHLLKKHERAVRFLRCDSGSTDYQCGRNIELATNLVLKKVFHSLCTGPIDKNNLQKGGYRYDGHTEMLQALCETYYKKPFPVTMMLAGPKLKVSLATIHIPISQVSKALTKTTLEICFLNTVTGLQKLFNIKKPKIAVLGLNPHAGDRGLFGNEESTVIRPSIAAILKQITNHTKTTTIDGPFAADGFFAQYAQRYSKSYDAVIAMYHDQGLIPAKMFDFDNTVNVTLGLPIIRTSVDHGVGFDIAGKNIANPASFIAAYRLARAAKSIRSAKK